MQLTNQGAVEIQSTTPATQRTNYPDGNRSTVPLELVRALYQPMPPEAIQPHPTKDYLSSVKAIFVIERLNEVFGMGGWSYRTEVIEASPDSLMVVVRVVLRVPAYGIRLEQFGGSDNKDRGDAYKGAVTDALSKCASYLGVAIDVYKGGGPTKRNPRGATVTQPQMVQQERKPVGPAAAVAERKIASGDVSSPAPWKSLNECIGMLQQKREKVGDVAFLGELERYGWHSLDQLRKAVLDGKDVLARSKAIELYTHLCYMQEVA
jgi:Rad52/22 family double-strand break repair protein